MRILYLSVHEILEYDELRLFTEMGHECYSLGAYTFNPTIDDGRKRPGIPGMPDDDHFRSLATRYSKDEMHPEMLEGMDMVIVMHEPSFIEKNWGILSEFIKKGGRVVWRSIGQSIPHVERRLTPFRAQGLEIVRYAITEQTIPDNIGADAVIRFYKDPDEYKGWIGAQKHVINFTQSLKQRAKFTGYDIFMGATEGFERRVYGPGNEDLGELSGGLLTSEQQMQTLRDNRVYFYHGTYPASYTLSFIEAWMTGIPVVSVGPRLGNGKDFGDQKTFEIPYLINNGINGFYADDITTLKQIIGQLMQDDGLAKAISVKGRQRAIELFGKGIIKQQWSDFFGGENSGLSEGNPTGKA